jgi:hypothetical protein
VTFDDSFYYAVINYIDRTLLELAAIVSALMGQELFLFSVVS